MQYSAYIDQNILNYFNTYIRYTLYVLKYLHIKSALLICKYSIRVTEINNINLLYYTYLPNSVAKMVTLIVFKGAVYRGLERIFLHISRNEWVKYQGRPVLALLERLLTHSIVENLCSSVLSGILCTSTKKSLFYCEICLARGIVIYLLVLQRLWH